MGRKPPYPRKSGLLGLEWPADLLLVTEARGRGSSARGCGKFELKLTPTSPAFLTPALRKPSGREEGTRGLLAWEAPQAASSSGWASSGLRSPGGSLLLSAGRIQNYQSVPRHQAKSGPGCSVAGSPPLNLSSRNEETRGHMGHPPASAPGPAVPRGPAAGPF